MNIFCQATGTGIGDGTVQYYILYTKGKTLILEAAAKNLSEKDDTEVVFIMALGETKKGRMHSNFYLECFSCNCTFVDYKDNSKKTDDILDIMLR